MASSTKQRGLRERLKDDSPPVRVGTAGWTLPKQHGALFPAAEEEGVKRSHLERYASRLWCAEINSSFHRPHRWKTWERWAATTPDGFRFSVKLPKTITHQAKLIDAGGLLEVFLSEVHGLGTKLGPLLVQLPPKLEFDAGVAHEFFTTLRELHPWAEDHANAEGACGLVACEPRHASWFAGEAGRLLREFGVARVAADPPKGAAAAGLPGGWPGLRYWRLHGAPRTYYTAYATTFLRALAKTLQEPTRAQQTWVIFDNTALGEATGNALELQRLLER